MAEARGPVVVVGGGLAGAKVVETLLAEGFDRPITLIGAESHVPYERPPLSKEYLQGAKDREAFVVHPASWYAERNVELLLGARVDSLDPGEREVVLADGSRRSWEHVVLATGSTPRHLDIPGSDLEGVHYLRTVDDSDRLRAVLGDAGRLVVVGGGWIGLEVAASARLAGMSVTVLEQGDLPLAAVLGSEVAGVFAELHRDHGVDLQCGVAVSEIVGTGGRVTGVRLADGSEVTADAVLVAVGATPATGLASAAGLRVDNGVQVDAALRSSAPGVLAIGDIASAHHPLLGRHLRVEHWDNAREQGAAAARTILGQSVNYARLPYFYTDQYELGMEMTGFLTPGGYDHVVLRGDVPGLNFVAIWLSRGKVVAGMGVNVWDAMDPVRALVESGRAVAMDRLRDPDVELSEL